MNLKKALKELKRKGFRIEQGNGSRMKVFPPDSTLPFYSLHAHGGTKAEKPFFDFARKNWDITL